jgi:hypothetical protein
MAAYLGHAYADVYATFESGRDAIVLLTNQCPSDKTGQLKLVISKIGGNVREGCYVINVRGNPVVKWQDGLLQELDSTLFRIDPSQAIVKKEVRPPPATLVTIDVKNEIDLKDGTYLAKEYGNQGRYAFITHSHGRFEGGDIAKAICSDGFLVSNLPVTFSKIKKALKLTDYVLTKCDEAD